MTAPPGESYASTVPRTGRSTPSCSQIVSTWFKVAEGRTEEGTATGFTTFDATRVHSFDEHSAECKRVQVPCDSTARTAWPPGNRIPPNENADSDVTTTGSPSFSLRSTEIVGSVDAELSLDDRAVPP